MYILKIDVNFYLNKHHYHQHPFSPSSFFRKISFDCGGISNLNWTPPTHPRRANWNPPPLLPLGGEELLIPILLEHATPPLVMCLTCGWPLKLISFRRAHESGGVGGGWGTWRSIKVTWLQVWHCSTIYSTWKFAVWDVFIFAKFHRSNFLL